MSGRGILDADMRTIGAGIVRGWEWWLEELRGLVPARMHRRRRDDLHRLSFTGDRLGTEDLSLKGGRAEIAVPPALCLTRTIERPAMSDRDLRRMLAFEGGTLLPFPEGTMIVAARKIDAAALGRMRIEIAGLPIDVARRIADAAAAVAARPVRVVVDDNSSSSVPLDFAPTMVEAGILSPVRSATPLIWGLVGFLAALNLGIMVWRDAASVDRLEQVVRDQQPAVAVAQTITRRAAQDRALAIRTIASRSDHDVMTDLAVVSRALPAGAWLQRYIWDGPTLRVAGYKPAKTDVASALRRSGRFTEVRSMEDETAAAVAVGDPFDVSARIIKR